MRFSLVFQRVSAGDQAAARAAYAQAVPIIGAMGGAAVNLIFIKHFQDMARGHFIVRRLERAHGQDIVRAEYETMVIGNAE